MSKKDKYGYRETFPRYFRADQELKGKVGTGSLDAQAVAKAQAYLDNIKTDVKPQLLDIIKVLNDGVSNARSVSYDREEFLPGITKPLMDIKALSGMFGQMMICRVSTFMLTFLEDTHKLDNDVLDIIGVYVRVVKALLDLGIMDETNPHGQNFLVELRNACKRYYERQQAMKDS